MNKKEGNIFRNFLAEFYLFYLFFVYSWVRIQFFCILKTENFECYFSTAYGFTAFWCGYGRLRVNLKRITLF